MSVETSLPWPSNIPELKRLDELLRCGICYDFMSTSMVTICSHNYCSICIRQYLGYKTQCPACFQETTCQQLRNNRLLDEIISLFPGLRNKIARHCQTTKGSTITGYLAAKDTEDGGGCEAVNGDLGKLGTASNLLLASTDVKFSPKQRDSHDSPSQQSSTKDSLFSPRSSKSSVAVETPKRNFGRLLSRSGGNTPLKSPQQLPYSSSPSSCHNSGIARIQLTAKSPVNNASASQSSSTSLTQNARQAVSGFFSIQNDRANTNGDIQEGPKVPCPVCNVSVPERNINLHLDACLKRMEEGNREEIVCIQQPPKRKPLPKLVYSLLSEKQLRQKLKEIGLSVQGEKQLLVSRHRKYTILYNAECDVAEPRPIQELLRQVEREEREEAKVTGTRSIFSYDRKTAPEVIEKEQTSYLKKNDGHFAKLIADVKRRRVEIKKKKEIKEEDVSDGLSNVPGTSKVSLNHRQNHKHKSNHQFSSSDDDSDSENSKEKLSNNGSDKQKLIINFFQNSPQKSTQLSCKKPSATDNNTKILELNLEDESSENDESCEENCNSLPHSSLENEHVKVNLEGKSGKKENDESYEEKTNSFPHSALENDMPSMQKELYEEKTNSFPHSSLENEHRPSMQMKSLEDTSHLGTDSDDFYANLSPDIFVASPAGSTASDESVSILQSQEPESPPPLEPTVLGSGNSDSEDEDLIPGTQPESCRLDKTQFETPPSPSIGRRVTRSKKPASQDQQPNLSALGPETQVIECDSQVEDPNYQPSQQLEAVSIEDVVPKATRSTRRSGRKRRSTERAGPPKRSRRKK